MEGAAGLAVAALAIRLGASVLLVALAWAALIGVALAFVDRAVHRLPDRLIIAGITGTLLGFGVAALGSDGASHLGTALLGAAGAGAVYLVMVLAMPGAIGPGDAKLAVLIGLATGWFGLPITVLALLCTVVLAGAGAVTMLVAGRAGRHDHLAYGPYMLAGALVAVLV